MIKQGDTVRYFQPDVDGILANWSGKTGGGGDVLTAVVESVTVTGDGTRYYRTVDGLILTDSDLR